MSVHRFLHLLKIFEQNNQTAYSSDYVLQFIWDISAEYQNKALDQSEMNRQKKENQAIFQLWLIVGSYVVGYLPTCGKQLHYSTWTDELLVETVGY